MKITESNVRRIVREELFRLMEQDDPKPEKIDDIGFYSEERMAYEKWAKLNRALSTELQSTMVDYFVDQGLQDAHDLHKKLASELGLDHDNLMAAMEKRLPKEEDPETEESARVLDVMEAIRQISKL